MTKENILDVIMTFFFLFGELFALFIGISFFVALLQIYVSKDKIKRILTRPHKVTNSILGALLGSITPFCSCSTIPVLVGLFKSGAPFSGAISFLLTSPILNPAIIALLLVFFGWQATIVYAIVTFLFAVVTGLLLDYFGFEKDVKQVSIKGGCCGEEITWEKLHGTFRQKQWKAMKTAIYDAFGLFRGVFLYLIIGAGIGAFIYGFIPQEFLSRFTGSNNWWSVPLAALAGIPMYIRTETMIPIAGVLMSKGISSGTMIALIIGGAGASIPEVSLLSSIFKKRMIITFVLCILFVAITTGYLFNILF